MTQQRRRGLAPLVRLDTDDREAGAVVHGRVQVVVALAPSSRRGGAPSYPPATAVGDATELLQVEVQQLARTLADVAERRPGRPVAIAQASATVPADDGVDRRARAVQQRRQSVRSVPRAKPEPEDATDPARLEGPWSAVRCRGPVVPPGGSLFASGGAICRPSRARPQPLPRRLPAPAVHGDPLYEEGPSTDGETAFWMGHENLRLSRQALSTSQLNREALSVNKLGARSS